MSDDYYSILGVPSTATTAEIKTRFRFLSHAYHPDKFGSDPHKQAAEEEFKRINEAHQILSDPSQRFRYDTARLRSQPPLPREQPSPQYDAPPRKPPNYNCSPRPARTPPVTVFSKQWFSEQWRDIRLPVMLAFAVVIVVAIAPLQNPLNIYVGAHDWQSASEKNRRSFCKTIAAASPGGISAESFYSAFSGNYMFGLDTELRKIDPANKMLPENEGQ